MIAKFEDILSWQQAQDLIDIVYQTFGKSRDFWFRDQITRAAISVSNNIAEWFERKTNNEFRQFLYIAKWSCGEVRSMLYFAKRHEYCSGADFEKMYVLSVSISSLLSKLIQSL